MAFEIKKALASTLKSIEPNATIYTHESKQSTKFPAFFITRISQKSSGGYMKHIKEVSFDVTYIQKTFDEADMDTKEHDLLSIEEFGQYRMINKNAYQVDDTLHFQFDVRYFELDDDEGDLMESLEELNEEVKDGETN